MPGHPFTVDEYVRWSDVDYAGIICYGAYVRFFEIAETEMFRAAGVPYGKVFDEYDIWLPRRTLNCEFTHPARLDDPLRVATYFPRIGNTSLTLHFDVVHVPTGKLAASGEEVLVCTTRDTLRPRPLPDELRTRFAPFVVTTEEARRELGIDA